MAAITFLGAAGTVTGSRFLVESRRSRVLVECGLFQGGRALRERNWRRLGAGRVDAVIVSHAHLDHCGYLPRLVRDGFQGDVHVTEPTADLVPILLRDAAWLEEESARRRLRHGEEDVVPLFTVDDAEDAISRLQGHPYDETVPVADGVAARFVRAGHILGSASLVLDVDGQTLVVSGDIGRYDAPLLRDPDPIGHADALVIESTYGDRDHPDSKPIDELKRVIRLVVEQRGVLLIPSFAVGRTQMVLHLVRELVDQGRVPKLPVYVDSPMATDVTDLFRKHADDLEPEQAARIRGGHSAFSPGDLGVTYVRDREGSKALNAVQGPMIVLSAAGMCTGGRVLHHLAHRLGDPHNVVCLSGWAAEGTLARRLLDGDHDVRLFGADVPVRARIERIEGLSAHADRRELARWLDTLESPPHHTWVVHGEPAAAEALERHLHGRGWSASVARDGERAPIPKSPLAALGRRSWPESCSPRSRDGGDPMTGVANPMLREDLMIKEIEALAQNALRLVRESPGRLVGLTVRIPPDLPAERFRELFDGRLADVGLDFVDLAVESGRGPMRIVAADFHAG